MADDLWGEMLDVLKDISSYLEKQDATQEKAEIDKPPKIKEHQKEIVGGSDPVGKPGEGFAKELPDVPDLSRETESIEDSGETQLKKAEKDDEEDSDEEDESKEEEDEEEESNDVEELKSLLKDIKSALLSKSEDKNISKMVSTEIKKELPNVMEKMLRKMGYNISKPDVVKFGVEDGILKKSSDETEKVQTLTDDKKVEELNKAIDDFSKKSWAELGRLRESTGEFRTFPR